LYAYRDGIAGFRCLEDKFENQFQEADIIVLKGTYNETIPAMLHYCMIFLHRKKDLEHFDGELQVKDGAILNAPTILHSRSVAENIKVFLKGNLFTDQSISWGANLFHRKG